MSTSRICLFVISVCCLANLAMAQGANSARSTFNNSLRTARQNILTRPTVSPYLRLLNNNGVNNNFGNVQPIYQTQVRPAIEARDQAAVQQQQIRQIQSQLNDVRRQFTRPNSGFMQTGHPTRFMTYSHYYPGMR